MDKTKKYDLFISYAKEDKQFASELFGAFTNQGIKTWYDEESLEVGDKILNSIEYGLRNSRYGLLLISKYYLEKAWTKNEMDILVRQHIEDKKQLFPIWRNVTKDEVKSRSLTLAGIGAAKSEEGLKSIVSGIMKQIYKGAPTVARYWHHPEGLPLDVFLRGNEELMIIGEKEEVAASIWDILLCFRDEHYPIGVEGGTILTKEDLLYHAACNLSEKYPNFGFMATRITEKKIMRLKQMCREAGYKISDRKKK